MRSEQWNGEQVYQINDPEGVRLTLSGPHRVGQLTGFGLSIDAPALALARQILQHAGYKDVEISYEATNAA